MARRVVQLPLSGGDRKAFVRELRRVEQRYESLLKQIPEAHRAAEAYRRHAHALECEAWSARLYLGGDLAPSPRIDDAIDAAFTILQVKCNACLKERDLLVTDFIWPRDKQVHTLRPLLFCRSCKNDTGRKVMPQLIGLFRPDSRTDGPAAAGAI